MFIMWPGLMRHVERLSIVTDAATAQSEAASMQMIGPNARSATAAGAQKSAAARRAKVMVWWTTGDEGRDSLLALFFF
jgi:hypothetical protein